MKRFEIDTLKNNIYLPINGEEILFFKTNPTRSSSGVYYESDNKDYFLKIFYDHTINRCFNSEISALRLVEKYNRHFSKIILIGDNYIVMTHCGERISENSIPDDVYEQVDDILSILKKEKIRHLDIKPHEVLIKNNQLYLVDFGFSRINLDGKHGPRSNDDVELNTIIDEFALASKKKNFTPRRKYQIKLEHMNFSKYIVTKRKEYNASQAQTSSLAIDGKTVTLDGYQTYTIVKDQKNLHIEIARTKLKVKCELINGIEIVGDSLLDLGCSNGAVGLWLGIKNNIKDVYLYDHDLECINNLNKVSAWMGSCGTSIHPMEYCFSDTSVEEKKCDYVITLATLHWFYSATTNMGCLYRIIEKLRRMTNKALVVEWVNENDSALVSLEHTSMNKEVHKTAYSRDNFISALDKNFKRYEKLGNTTLSRELFVAYVS